MQTNNNNKNIGHTVFINIQRYVIMSGHFEIIQYRNAFTTVVQCDSLQ